MQGVWLVVAVLGCRDEQHPAPNPVKPPHTDAPTPRIAADPLLAEALARSEPGMGLEKLYIWGLQPDGALDPNVASIKVTWQSLPRTDDEDLGAVDAPCVKLAWSQAEGWTREPDHTCKAIGRPGLGYDRLGLPRCSIVEIVRRLTAHLPPSGDLLLSYSPCLPYEDGDKLSPGQGLWQLSVHERGASLSTTETNGYDTCGMPSSTP